jgi:hypothetical protein
MKFGKFEIKRGKLTLASAKQKFDWDISDLEDYIDEQSPEIMEDLIATSNLKSRISIMPDVKGSKLIKLISSEPSLQAAAVCGWTPEGGMVLTDVTIATVRVKIQEEYCNEDLNDTWAQLENRAGANDQDKEAPAFADRMIVYYQERANELDEALMMNGDTLSGNPNLAFYDGFLKLWFNDGTVNVVYSLETVIDATNGYDILKEVDNAVPVLVKRNAAKIGYEIICGRETAQFCIDQVWNDKDYASNLAFTDKDGELSFILPSTTTRVRSIPSLDGTTEVFGVPYKYMFWATDVEGDMKGFEFKYDDTEEMLRFSVKWRSGVQFVYGKYFTRLRLTATS